MSDANLLLTVEDLINISMGPPEVRTSRKKQILIMGRLRNSLDPTGWQLD